MLSGIMNWSKKRKMLAISVFVFLLAAIIIYNTYATRVRYEEQAVMAQNYLDTGSFEEAQKAFLKALSMNYGDREYLSIGLAESYAGINDYDKALEALRSRYEAEKTTAVREKIEEITARKTDYSFDQLISFGDTYFSNEEYNKAIEEYEKAKLIKSKVDISYLKIVESYMAMERYDLAKDEAQDGLALAESDRLMGMINKVETRINELKYDEIIGMASEYIYQENYEEAFNRFNEAIWLISEKDTAYNHMAELYITMGDYNAAKGLLQNYLRSNVSDLSLDILHKVNELISQKTEKERLLNELYTALTVVDIEAITRIMKDSTFINIIVEDAPVYYSPSGDINLSMGYGMLISDEKSVYAGGFRNRMKDGIGIQFMLRDSLKDLGWYYYQGEWNHDMPNRMGKTAEKVFEENSGGKLQSKIIETIGMFLYGLEDGEMQKTLYVDNEEVGRIHYKATEGVPMVYLDEDGQPVPAAIQDHYVIGRIYLNNKPTGEYYSVKQGKKFTVKLSE